MRLCRLPGWLSPMTAGDGSRSRLLPSLRAGFVASREAIWLWADSWIASPAGSGTGFAMTMNP
jgi:hypothetical protein